MCSGIQGRTVSVVDLAGIPFDGSELVCKPGFACGCARCKAASGRAAALHFDGRTACRLPCGARFHGPSRNSLRSLCSLRSDNRDENVYEARCARGRESCAPRHRRGAPKPTRAQLCRGVFGSRREPHSASPLKAKAWSAELKPSFNAGWWAFRQNDNTNATSSRQAVSGEGDFCGGEERSNRVGARSALRNLTHRGCPNGVNKVSSAMRLWCEHRSAVDTKCDSRSMSPRRISPAATRAMTQERAADNDSSESEHAICN